MKFKRNVVLLIVFCSLIIGNLLSDKSLVFANEEPVRYSEQASQTLNIQNKTDAEIIENDKTIIEKIVYKIFGNCEIKNCEVMYNLDKSPDYIYVEFEPTGYAIFSSVTMELMEYGLLSKCPYLDTAAKKYYAGPTNYFYKKDNCFINAINGELITMEAEEIKSYSNLIRQNTIKSDAVQYVVDFNSEVMLSEVEGKLDTTSNLIITEGETTVPSFDNPIVPSLEGGVLDDNYWYFLANPKYGRNYDGEVYGDHNNKTGTCGPIAAQILLNYNNYFNDRRIIPNRFLYGYDDETNQVVDPETNPNYCDDPMKITSEILGSRSAGNGENDFYAEMIRVVMKDKLNGSNLNDLVSGINEYLSDKIPMGGYTINSNSYSSSSSYDRHLIENLIANGNPVILRLSKEAMNSKKAGHFVVAYGSQTYSYPNGAGTYNGYVVDFGWGVGDYNYLCVWANEAWVTNYITFEAQHEHVYLSTGYIENTNIRKYTCNICGHRTDEYIYVSMNDRHVERRISCAENKKNKEFIIKFKYSGNKIVQTFGTTDTSMYLYDNEGNLLIYDDDSGYSKNAFICYNFISEREYKLRIESNTTANHLITKLGISPIVNNISSYENIQSFCGDSLTYSFTTTLGATEVFLFKPEDSGFYTFKALNNNSRNPDTYLYLIDPSNTNECMEDDDSGGYYQAQIQKKLFANKYYYVVVSTRLINSQYGNIILNISIES